MSRAVRLCAVIDCSEPSGLNSLFCEDHDSPMHFDQDVFLPEVESLCPDASQGTHPETTSVTGDADNCLTQ